MWICVCLLYHVQNSLRRESGYGYLESFDVEGFDHCAYDMWLINSIKLYMLCRTRHYSMLFLWLCVI